MLFSTRAIEPKGRRDAWLQAISQRCGDFSVDFGPSEFEGALDTRQVGQFSCARMSQTSRATFRGWREIEAQKASKYLVILQLAGVSRMEQAGRTTEMTPGNLTIIDSTLPCRFEFFRKNIHLSLHIPKPLLDGRRDDWHLRTATSPQIRESAPLTSLIRAAFESDGGSSEAQRQAISASVLNLLESVWSDGEVSDVARDSDDELLREVQAYIARRLDEESLTPIEIARANNMSERQLHRIFQASGATVCGWIRQSRLDRCAADLRDPGLARKGITAIAFRWGFNDAGHFSRVFRAEFGQSPRDYRAALVS